MSTLKYGLGYKQNPPDPRDHTLQQFGIEPSSTTGDIDLAPFIRTIRDQESTSSCTGQAITGAIDIRKSIKGVYTSPTSALYAYFTGRLNEYPQGTDPSKAKFYDEGAYPRGVAKAATNSGLCDESTWKFVASKVNDVPGLDCLMQAHSRIGGKYAYISNSSSTREAEIISALQSGYPVMFGAQLVESFMDVDSTDCIVPKPSYKDHFVGGHAMVVVGYCTIKGVQYFKVLNSWGTGWGQNGLCYFTKAYINSELCTDFGVVQGYELIA